MPGAGGREAKLSLRPHKLINYCGILADTVEYPGEIGVTVAANLLKAHLRAGNGGEILNLRDAELRELHCVGIFHLSHSCP